MLADRVTVLRDGRLRGSALVDDVTDDELLALIVGRQLDSTFPPKPADDTSATSSSRSTGLTGDGFSDVSFTGRRGEILGVGGVVGNGQTELLRALAGLAGLRRPGRRGRLATQPAPAAQGLGLHARGPAPRGPDDDHVGARERRGQRPGQDDPRPVRQPAARARARRPRAAPSWRSRPPRWRRASPRCPAATSRRSCWPGPCSPGPAILLADEPTQGVDVGARAEIYRILREVADDGVPVVVASSDAKELEGLCDRVVVMSRGHVVADLVGDEVTEERMIRAAVASTAHPAGDRAAARRRPPGPAALARGRLRPGGVLAVVMVGLGAYIYSQNDRYLSPSTSPRSCCWSPPSGSSRSARPSPC